MNETKKLSIKDWNEDDRPREKMLNKGIDSLSNAELIAILIGSGNRNETAVELSKRILNDNENNLNELGKKSIEQLMQYRGIGEAKAISICAALELGKRRKLSEILDKKSITSSEDAFEIFYSVLNDLPHEEFWVLLLNHANKVIDKQRISRGGIASTITDIRLILKAALDKMSPALILGHNHPSGNLNPSKEDRALTAKIIEAGKIMDIKILDHIIVANSRYYSFADNAEM